MTQQRTVTHKAPAWPGYWTSSQLGCWRRCFLLAREIEGDFYESPVLAEGRLHEDDIIARLQVAGVVVKDRNVEWRHPTLPLRGHPDGRTVITKATLLDPSPIPPGRYIMDVKSMDRPFFAKAIKDFAGNFPHLYYQVQSYSLMSEDHEPIYIPIKNRASGEIHELWFDPDPETWSEIEDWIGVLEQAVKNEGFDYRGLPCPDPESLAGRYCPYKDVGMCEHDTNIPDVTEAEVVQALFEYDEGATLVRTGTKMKDKAKDIVVAYLKKHNLRRVKIGDRVPSLGRGSRKRVDYDKLKEKWPVAYREVVSESSYDIFDAG